jgi:hypothetical protein
MILSQPSVTSWQQLSTTVCKQGYKILQVLVVFKLLKPTGYVLQQQVALPRIIRYAHSVFTSMCFVFIWEQTATCATYIIIWLVFITERKIVYCAVQTGCLNIAVCSFIFEGLKVTSLSAGKWRHAVWFQKKFLSQYPYHVEKDSRFFQNICTHPSLPVATLQKITSLNTAELWWMCCDSAQCSVCTYHSASRCSVPVSEITEPVENGWCKCER